MKSILTNSAEETKEFGKLLAEQVYDGDIICFSGDLGSGKTTFTQGFLEGLGVKGPYISPTFAIMKEYGLEKDNCGISKIYHIDTYRVEEKDIVDLGWNDFAGKENSIVLVEWAERIQNLIPKNATWIKFKWKNENQREIEIS